MSSAYPTIFTVFAGKCRELATDTRGAALAITLAFVMPVYLLVIGIYGIGEVVRNKIELQNAADAAAYSAAVVQADYLSRMATVNKAMAWTYVDLQKRSLDLAMDLFCNYIFIQFQKDLNTARQRNTPCHMHVPGLHYNCGTDILVNSLFLEIAGTGAGIPELAKKFNGQSLTQRFLLLQAFHTLSAQFKGKGSVTNTPKVAEYSLNITKMMAKLNKLRQEYPKMVKQTAQQIAIANMMECKDDYFVNVSMGNTDTGFLTMMGTEENEKTFISFADPTLKDFSPKKVFGPGTDDWIVRKTIPGFWRVYRQTKTHLYAKWDWFWTRWVHVNLGEIQLHLPPIFGGAIGQGHPEYHGYDSFFPLIKKDLPIGLAVPPAIPLTLTPLFFGKAGSITVAIARRTSNPFSVFSWSGRSLTAPSILSAFNPSVAGGNRPEYMCAIASARAGYKLYEKDKQKKFKSADYNLGYTLSSGEKEWNLVETDWDGVMLPVKNAWDLCAGAGQLQAFTIGSGNILKEIMLDKKNWVDAKGKKVEDQAARRPHHRQGGQGRQTQMGETPGLSGTLKNERDVRQPVPFPPGLRADGVRPGSAGVHGDAGGHPLAGDEIPRRDQSPRRGPLGGLDGGQSLFDADAGDSGAAVDVSALDGHHHVAEARPDRGTLVSAVYRLQDHAVRNPPRVSGQLDQHAVHHVGGIQTVIDSGVSDHLLPLRQRVYAVHRHAEQRLQHRETALGSQSRRQKQDLEIRREGG